MKKNVKTPSLSGRAGMGLKICGMKHNIAEVAALQPDYLGFIFYEKSPRYFEGEIPSLSRGIKKVGVFVDATIAEILGTFEKIQFGCNSAPRQRNQGICCKPQYGPAFKILGRLRSMEGF